LSLFGSEKAARFGHSVANLGDLDKDGLEDFAVGSPFEDQGRGTIRIYYGKRIIENIQGTKLKVANNKGCVILKQNFAHRKLGTAENYICSA
jgi:hypothetical protein